MVGTWKATVRMYTGAAQPMVSEGTSQMQMVLGGRYLDAELINRRKQGFGFPLAFWMRNELSGFLRAVVAESRFVSEGIFEHGYLSELVDQHLAGKRDHNFRLWVILNLEIWHRLYIEGMPMEEVSEWIERHGPPAPALAKSA